MFTLNFEKIDKMKLLIKKFVIKKEKNKYLVKLKKKKKRKEIN